MCRSPSWLLMSWCLASGLNLFASAAPPPVSDPARSLVAERDLWMERCAQNGLNPESSIGTKLRPLEAIYCGYLVRTRSTPVKSSEDETFIDRILRSGLLRKREEDSLEDERSQSKSEGDSVGKLLEKDRFVEALPIDGPQPKTWSGYDQAEWSPIPVVKVPMAVDDSVDTRSDGSWETRSTGQDSSLDLERFLESKRSDSRMTREKAVHGGPGQGTGHPRWSVYFIG